MKKIFMFIFFFSFLLIFTPYTQANKVDNSENYHKIEKEYLYDINSNISYIDETTHNVNDVGYIDKYEITIEGEIKNYIINNDDIYILYVNRGIYYVYKKNIINSTTKTISINGELNDILVSNNFIYLVGKFENDAILYIYELDLEYVSRYEYGGEGREEFTRIKCLNSNLYLFGIKDAISKNSEFANVGNTDEIKSFVIKLDGDYKIVNDIYINENHIYEEIYNIIINNNKIYLNIMTEVGSYYQYVLDENLKILEHFSMNFLEEIKYIKLVETYNLENEYLYVYILDNTLYYCIFTNELEYCYLLAEDVMSIYYSKIINGILNIYCNNDGEMVKFKVSEYHINKLDTKVVKYQDITYDETTHFKVESYLEKLDFKYDYALNEHIMFNKSIETSAVYFAINGCGEKVTIKTPYIVESYINVIHGGIYPTGYKLLFSDDVYVNDKQVYNGEILNEEGLYKITHIIDSSKEIKDIYYIYIVDNYYKDLSMNYIEADITLGKNERYYYEIELSKNMKVNKIIINDQEYEYLQSNNKVTICFNASEKYGIDNYRINKIVFEDDTELIINKLVTIKTTKLMPVIDIYYENEKIIYDIIDNDSSIMDIKIKFYQNDMLIKEEITKLKHYQLVLPKEDTKIEIYLLYEDGCSNVYEELLFELKGSSIKKDEQLFTIEYIFDDKLKQISLNNITNNSVSIETSNISNTSLNNLFNNNNNNNNFIYITLGITLFILLSIGVIIIYRKKKNE